MGKVSTAIMSNTDTDMGPAITLELFQDQYDPFTDTAVVTLDLGDSDEDEYEPEQD